jgi:hypothetical protein
MKMFDSVVIAHDQSSWQIAYAIRAGLECSRVRSHLYYCVQEKNVIEVLSGNIPKTEYVVLCPHGVGRSDGPSTSSDDLQIGFHVVSKKDGKWQPVEFVLTPENIPAIVNLKGRKVIALGCGNGRTRLGEAFIASGVQCYIGANEAVDEHAAAVFCNTFFYHMLATEMEGPECSDAEAVKRASAIDTYPSGTHLFRYYEGRTASAQ